MVLLVIGAILYIDSYWRLAWFHFIEVSIPNCYYFMVDNLTSRSKVFTASLRTSCSKASLQTPAYDSLSPIRNFMKLLAPDPVNAAFCRQHSPLEINDHPAEQMNQSSLEIPKKQFISIYMLASNFQPTSEYSNLKRPTYATMLD
uniref:Uncharacterized protein n=1 Tax=Salix viminalis TaxID=40686 RepID=A0A6N2MV75_SALVM